MNNTIKGHRMSDKESFNMLMNEIDKAFISSSKKELDIIFDMTFNDVFGDMPCDHLGTFVEVKDMPIKIEDFKKYSIKWVSNWEDINENNSTR